MQFEFSEACIVGRLHILGPNVRGGNRELFTTVYLRSNGYLDNDYNCNNISSHRHNI